MNKSGYRDLEKLRKYLSGCRKRYYERYNFGDGVSKRRYSPEDDEVIMLHEETDRKIAEKLGRSVRSIQIRRSRLKSGIIPYNGKAGAE